MSAAGGLDLNRRWFLNAGAVVSAAGLAGCTAATRGHGRPVAARPGLNDAVLEAFKTHRLVAFGAADSLQNHYDVLGLLLSDLRLAGVVDDVIIEWGNPLYQDTVDQFIGGEPITDADLRSVWRNTTQSPLETWDARVYEQFYRLMRAVNWTLPAGKQIRVLAGDSPIDWAKITKPSQLHQVPPRGPFVASLVQHQVLAKGRRALLCYGMTGLFHGTGVTDAIEKQTGQRIYIIADLVPLAGDPGRLATKLSGYARNTVIPTAGTWLGSFNAGFLVSEGRPGGTNPFCGVHLGTLIDAGLYPGQPGVLTASWPDPDIYYYPPYWAELQRRNTLTGNGVDLASYRQEKPARYPLTKVPPSQKCS